MTAITQVINYTVRCPHYQPPTPDQIPTWQDHIEINHSSEMALSRISKWHAQSGNKVFSFDDHIVVRKAEKEDAYFAMFSERLKSGNHALVTIKIFMDNKTKDASIEDIVAHLHQDCLKRLA